MQFLPPPDSPLYIPLVVLYALTALSLVLFICLYLRERRSVFVGWLLIATVGSLGTSLGVTAIVAENQILLVLALPHCYHSGDSFAFYASGFDRSVPL